MRNLVMKDDFLRFIETSNNLNTKKNSCGLVFLKIILEQMNAQGEIDTQRLLYSFKIFYTLRKKSGHIPDINAADCINQIEKSSISDLWKAINPEIYKILHAKGFVNATKKADGSTIFVIPSKLIRQLSNENILDIITNIKTKLELYFSIIDSTHSKENNPSIAEINSKSNNELKAKETLISELPVCGSEIGSSVTKRVITPTEKLEKRIRKEFETKKFIGDILINEEEYQLLIELFKAKCRTIINSYIHKIIDPVYATIMVQIGIKFYDGNYWGHIAKILNLKQIKGYQQAWLGDSFVETLKKYNKLTIDENAKVNNILMHGIVSNNYADDFFNFLFAFYRIDLDRDIGRIDKSIIDSLIDNIIRNDNTSRTYWLINQTTDAVRANKRGCKIRIRRFIRLIDNYFWNGVAPVNSTNRITMLLNKWFENSKEFKSECSKLARGQYESGKRFFKSPYIKCDYQNTTFKLIIPTQLVKNDQINQLFWRVCISGKVIEVNAKLLQAVIGYKIEKEEISIEPDDLFSKINIELISNNERIRNFKIQMDDIRFFDEDGFLVITDSLHTGKMYSFNIEGTTVKSDALDSWEFRGKLIMSCFEFQYGDILILPDGKPLSIGKKIEEGLMQRGIVQNAYVEYKDNDISIYKTVPSILIKISESRFAGTMVTINGKNNRISDFIVTKIDINDRSGEIGYLLNLNDLGCLTEGIYTIGIDVPNDRTKRIWQFVYISGLEFTFEDAPYIFKTKGSISFNEKIKLSGVGNNLEKIFGENTYNFDINPNEKQIHFKYTDFTINIDIPVLNWSFNAQDWYINAPADMWHSSFPVRIYFRFKDEKIKIYMDETEDEEELEEHSMIYSKSKEKDIFECDMTRFKSWFGREQVEKSLYLELSSGTFPFLNVITRSSVNKILISGDFDKNMLIGEFEIDGESSYYIDIEFGRDIIVDKLKLNNGGFRIPSNLKSGQYKISVYEDEDNDTGFGTDNFLLISSQLCQLLNPYDLSGREIKIEKLRKSKFNYFQISINSLLTYVIKNLKIVSKEDKNNYQGLLLIIGEMGVIKEKIVVNVEFPDLKFLSSCNIKFCDDDDLQCFLYDNEKRLIVKEEIPGLKASVKYRRYDYLDDLDYSYEISFLTNEMLDNKVIPVHNYKG